MENNVEVEGLEEANLGQGMLDLAPVAAHLVAIREIACAAFDCSAALAKAKPPALRPSLITENLFGKAEAVRRLKDAQRAASYMLWRAYVKLKSYIGEVTENPDGDEYDDLDDLFDNPGRARVADEDVGATLLTLGERLRDGGGGGGVKGPSRGRAMISYARRSS
jgi:hypothetical protein